MVRVGVQYPLTPANLLFNLKNPNPCTANYEYVCVCVCVCVCVLTLKGGG